MKDLHPDLILDDRRLPYDRTHELDGSSQPMYPINNEPERRIIKEEHQTGYALPYRVRDKK